MAVFSLLPASGIIQLENASWKAYAASEGSYDVDFTLAQDCEAHIVLLATNTTNTANIRLKSTIQANSRLHWHICLFGAQEIDLTLDAEVHAHATSNIDTLFTLADTEKLNISVRNLFAERDGGGEILMRGIARDKAFAKASGMIDIGEQANGTQTYLTQEVLMLDPTAKVDAIPGLEIKTNDVKASHSASVHQLTPEDLFYCLSRGIPEQDARRMMIEGFLKDPLEKLEPSIREEAETALMKSIQA